MSVSVLPCVLLCPGLMAACQFYEADEQHRKQEAELKARLEQLERDTEQHQAVVDGLTTKYMETIERLQSDKARLEVRVSSAGAEDEERNRIYLRSVG